MSPKAAEAPITPICEPAPAKLNLALHVRARRADGFHELETLFAFVTIGDTVRVAIDSDDAFEVTGPFAGALAGEGDNLVLRATRGFVARFGVTARHAIVLDKRLPVASGMGGGSADAAAALRALARLHGVGADDPALFALAGELGSDVPACLYGRTALGRGRGERLEPVAGAPGVPVLLVNPGVPVSTREVFARWDGIDRGPVADAPLLAAAAAGRNDLESPARALAPEIDGVLAALADRPGALLVRMSGSGATCFALFETDAMRDAAAMALDGQGWWVQPTHLV